MRAPSGGRVLAATLVLTAGSLGAATIRVPRDRPLISLAVAGARPGDIIEVDDGLYFEKNVVVDKAVTIRSKNLFGAVVYGSREAGAAIFLVRAACRIEGLVLKSAFTGILQRDSPDVLWTGRDLALFDLGTGVSINDRADRAGSAVLRNIVASGCRLAFGTNDARGLDVSRALVVDAESVFSGFDHEYFKVRDIIAWNCLRLAREETVFVPPPATNAIVLGPGIETYGPADPKAKIADIGRRVNGLFDDAPGPAAGPEERRRRRDAILLTIVGEISLKSGNIVSASQHFETALDLNAAVVSAEVEWQATYGLARAAEARGDWPRALDFYEKTVAVIEGVGNDLPIRTFQSDFFKDKIVIYQALIRRLWALHSQNPRLAYDEKAFLYVESSKARGFLWSLQQADANDPGLADRALAEGTRETSRRVTALQVGLQDPGLSADGRKTLLGRLDAAENEGRGLVIRIFGEKAGRRDYPKARLRSLQEIRAKLLNSETALLEYLLGEEGSLAFLVTADGLRIAELPPEGEIRPLVANYLKFLKLKEGTEFRGAAGGRKLFDRLVRPFQGRLRQGIRKLVVVPDGILHYLPFETLVSAEDSLRYLVEDFEVSYGPSASTLISQAERPAPAAYRMDFLGVANPAPVRAFSLSSSDEVRFPSLPFAVREVRAIRRLFPRRRTDVLLGRDAREKTFKARPLDGFRFIHIVAHGFFDDRNWWRSAVLLGRDPGGAEDGFVQVNDLYFLRFRPEILVLSGCETGAGHLEKGEGLSGLSFAFLNVGARSILFSLWNINDRATAAFMERFYRHLVKGRPKTEALRRAKLEMLTTRDRLPFYWAAFVIQGI